MISDKHGGGHIAPSPSNIGSARAKSSPTQQRDQGDKFARSLQQQGERLQSEESRAGEGGKSAQGKKVAAREQRDGDARGGGDQDQGRDGGQALAAPLSQSGAATPQSVAASGQLQKAMAGQLPAHIEKMAAAIHELAAKGVDARFTLELPLGSLTVQSAVLGRDAAGNISIQLLASGQMPAAMMNRAAADIAQRLRQRKLKIAEVAFGAGPKDTDDRVTARREKPA